MDKSIREVVKKQHHYNRRKNHPNRAREPSQRDFGCIRCGNRVDGGAKVVVGGLCMCITTGHINKISTELSTLTGDRGARGEAPSVWSGGNGAGRPRPRPTRADAPAQ